MAMPEVRSGGGCARQVWRHMWWNRTRRSSPRAPQTPHTRCPNCPAPLPPSPPPHTHDAPTAPAPPLPPNTHNDPAPPPSTHNCPPTPTLLTFVLVRAQMGMASMAPTEQMELRDSAGRGPRESPYASLAPVDPHELGTRPEDQQPEDSMPAPPPRPRGGFDTMSA
eukprot:39832-Chlamydomonas_euryale.AAC.1